MGVYLATVSSIDSLDENGNPATARVLRTPPAAS